MRNPKVLIIVDHPNRDLRGLLLIAVELASRGFEVSLTPHNLAEFQVWRFCPNLVVLNYLRTNNQHLVSDLIRAGIEFCVLDTEGGVFENYDVFLKSLTPKRDLLQKCAGYFAWGKKIQNVLIENSVFDPKKICVTGQPRMDFYHVSLSGALANLHQESASYSDYILVNGTFSFSKPRFSTPEKEFEQVTKLFGLSRDYAVRMLNYEKNVYPQLMDLITKLAQDFPDTKIIYRPHPFENPDDALKALSNLKNVEVNNRGSVDGWIQKARALIQLNCSTAFEANFLGVPVLLPMFLGEPFGDPRIKSISHLVQSYDELKTILANMKNYERPAQSSAEWERLLEDIYFANDGKSYLRCADAIEAIIRQSNNNPDREIIAEIQKRVDVSDSSGLRRIVKGFCARLGLARLFKFGDRAFVESKAVKKWKSGSKYFGTKDIEKLLFELKKIRPNWASVKILQSNTPDELNSVSVRLVSEPTLN